MSEKSKDVTIGERRFRIDLVPADVGNWIVLQIGSGKIIQEDVFAKIQSHLLSRCSIYHDDETPVRIYQDGKWTDPKLGLQYDLITVNDLMTEAMAFNFDPFFAEMQRRNPAAFKGGEAASATLQLTSQTT